MEGAPGRSRKWRAFLWIKPRLTSFCLQHKISPVPPIEYADRFFAFMKAVMRGGEGGEPFKVKTDKIKAE